MPKIIKYLNGAIPLYLFDFLLLTLLKHIFDIYLAIA